MEFKEFLLNENKSYLAQKIGDILTASQELRDDVKNMGSRDIIRFTERIINQIRRILHSNWTKEELKTLKGLQKIGVSLSKGIEEKDNLPEVISGATALLEKLSSDMGQPINKIASNQEDETQQDDTTTSTTESPNNGNQ
jgi:hypothetical protein